jgi:hypothetical protein
MKCTEPQRRETRSHHPPRFSQLHQQGESLELAAVRLTWANKFLPDTTTLRIVLSAP